MNDRVWPCEGEGCEVALPWDAPSHMVLGKNVGTLCPSCLGKAREARLAELLEATGIPGHFRAKLASLARKPWPSTDRPWLLIQGGVGAGKTHLAIEYGLALPDPRHVRFVSWPQFMEDRKRAIGTTDAIDPLRDVQRWAGFLILDDLGAETPGSWATESVNLILSYRYNENLRTILTTNLNGEELEKLYGERITSRIAGAAKVGTPSWKRDRRRREKAA